MEEKLTVGQKLKGHFKKHKTKYLVGTGLVVVGGTVGIYLGNKGIINAQLINTGTVNQNQYIDKSVNVLSRRGHAGTIVKCLETGETFASQNHAADSLGISASSISKHLKGKTPNVKGLHFEELGTFNANEQLVS